MAAFHVCASGCRHRQPRCPHSRGGFGASEMIAKQRAAWVRRSSKPSWRRRLVTSICLLLLPRRSCLFNKLFSVGSQGKSEALIACLCFFGMAEVTKTSFPSATLNIALYKTSRCVTNPLGFLRGLGTACQQHSCGVCAPSWKGRAPEKDPSILALTKNISFTILCAFVGHPAGVLRVTPWDCPHPLGDVGGGLIYSRSSSAGSDD